MVSRNSWWSRRLGKISTIERNGCWCIMYKSTRYCNFRFEKWLKIGSGFIKELVNLLLNWFLHCKICNNILIFEYTSSMIQFDENSIIFLSDFLIRHSLFLMFCRKFAYISRDERRKIFYVTVAKNLTIWL